MASSRSTPEERAYWARVREANDALDAATRPPGSLRETFDRMEEIRARLGRLAEPSLPPDDAAAIRESLELRERFRRKQRRGA